MIRKICPKTIFILKLYAKKLEANCGHLACNQIKTRIKVADKMAAKMEVYNKKIRKSSLRLVSLNNLHAKFYFTDFRTTNIILVTSQ